MGQPVRRHAARGMADSRPSALHATCAAGEARRGHSSPAVCHRVSIT